MKKSLIFAVLAIILLLPWPVAYAHENALAGAESARVKVATAGRDAAPSLEALGGAIGGIEPGDLFYIDTMDRSADVAVSLHLTNADELIHNYRYMTLEVEVYVGTGDETWEEATFGNGEELPDTYITMRNGQVSFVLPGHARYKIAIDGGCFYRYSNSAGDVVSPSFYLSAE